jgi:DNA-binding response OmpR family regulator
MIEGRLKEQRLFAESGLVMHQILIVDDEQDIRSLIRIHLERADMQIFEAESGRQAIERMQEHPFDLMILDLMMDDGNGFEVLQYLRNNCSKTIVIALSARREVQDKVDTLGLGADDYVTKPFSPIELLACVQAQFRRHRTHEPQQSEIIRLNKLVLDVVNFVLHNGSQRHILTQYECELHIGFQEMDYEKPHKTMVSHADQRCEQFDLVCCALTNCRKCME